jgi:transposase
LSTKIHSLTDAAGLPIRGCLTAGQVNDVTQALPLLQGLRIGTLIGDKAYDANAVLATLKASGARAVIPPRARRLQQRRFSKSAYRRRNRIERWFCRLKQFRRIATRYDKLAERFVSFISLASAVCWLR